MKATDLMIGDYIQDLAGDLCQVILIDRKVAQVETLTGVHQGDTTRYLHEAEGVPLTPEILKKNGFESRGAQFFCDHIGMIWWKDNIFMFSKYTRHEDLPTENISINIGYVHELQHALRRCGIEKKLSI